MPTPLPPAWCWWSLTLGMNAMAIWLRYRLRKNINW